MIVTRCLRMEITPFAGYVVAIDTDLVGLCKRAKRSQPETREGGSHGHGAVRGTAGCCWPSVGRGARRGCGGHGLPFSRRGLRELAYFSEVPPANRRAPSELPGPIIS
jgi:hypothetical protein